MTSLSPAEAHALARIDGLRPALLAEIEAWAAINTGSRNLAGLAHMADVAALLFVEPNTMLAETCAES
jgi:glutamate carboxypeptidase